MQNIDCEYFAFLFLMVFTKSATLGNKTELFFINY